MIQPSKNRDSWVMWLSGLFAVVGFAVFTFAIISQRPDLQNTEIPETMPENTPLPTTRVDGKFSVVRVHDGDSITLVGADGLDISVRLRGIDAPELGQPYGYEAKLALQTLCIGNTISLSEPENGKYGRYIADLYLGDKWVNHAMVAGGHAWCDKVNSYSTILYSAEQQAKSEGTGLWASPKPDPPWIWRSEKR